MSEKKQDWRLIFSNICQGFQSERFLGQDQLPEERIVYIKHFNAHDFAPCEFIYQQALENTKANDIPTIDEAVMKLKVQKLWQDENEKKIDEIYNEIDDLTKTRQKLHLKSQLDELQKQIDLKKVEYNKLREEKESLIGITCESFANRKHNEFMIINSVFIDKELKIRLIQDELYDELQDQELGLIADFYNERMQKISEQNIKNIAIKNFAQDLWTLSSDSPYNFFGKRVCDLTVYQSRLAAYLRLFNSIINEAIEKNWPEEVMSDPDKLLDYNKMQKNKQEIEQKTEYKGDIGSKSFVGATKEDLEAMGVNMEDTLQARAKKTGKKRISMEELVKMHNGG